jgi:hypothetical protein
VTVGTGVNNKAESDGGGGDTCCCGVLKGGTDDGIFARSGVGIGARTLTPGEPCEVGGVGGTGGTLLLLAVGTGAFTMDPVAQS